MAASARIDLSVMKIDYLTPIPPEILQNIISYLLAEHNPDRTAEHYRPSRFEGPGPDHTLDFLAATCRTLRLEVMDFALHFRLQHGEIMKFKRGKLRTAPKWRGFLRGPYGLIEFIHSYCVFCGKESVRWAVLANGLKCCRYCDKQQWAEKITLTEALKVFRLSRGDLISDSRYGAIATSMKRLSAKPVRYGTYLYQGRLTVMFWRPGIEELAIKINGKDRAFRPTKRREQ